MILIFIKFSVLFTNHLCLTPIIIRCINYFFSLFLSFISCSIVLHFSFLLEIDVQSQYANWLCGDPSEVNVTLTWHNLQPGLHENIDPAYGYWVDISHLCRSISRPEQIYHSVEILCRLASRDTGPPGL